MQEISNKQGCFIAFEGIDGSGKSTQIQLLNQRLKTLGINHCCTCEPTDSPIGSLIRQIMSGETVSDNRIVAALFVADRLDHLLNPVNGIYAKIMDGISVITDRYYFSSYAYQSIDLPMDWVIGANSQSAELLRPTATIFIDIDPDCALERIAKARPHTELFENHERLTAVRKKYFEAFDRMKGEENIVIVDGSKEIRSLETDIWDKIKTYWC